MEARFDRAVAIVAGSQGVHQLYSAAFIDWLRAADLIDRMEQEGMIGPPATAESARSSAGDDPF